MMRVSLRPTNKTIKVTEQYIDWELFELVLNLWIHSCLPGCNTGKWKNAEPTIPIQFIEGDESQCEFNRIFLGDPKVYGCRWSLKYIVSNILHEFAHWYQMRILKRPNNELVGQTCNHTEYWNLPGERHARRCENHTKYILTAYRRFESLSDLEYRP